MYSVIKIESGPNAGTELPVSDEVVRVGSHATMNVALDKLPPHAMTLIANGTNGCWVVNRACDSLRVAGKNLPVGERREWKFGSKITVADASWKLARTTSDQANRRGNETSSANKSRWMGTSKTTVYAAAIVVFAAIFLFDSDSEAPRRNDSVYYGVMIKDSHRVIPHGDYRMNHARFLIQRSRHEEILANPQIAKQGYHEAINFLRERRRADDLHANNKPLQELELRFRTFAADRIKHL